jgi:hypothetical protein
MLSALVFIVYINKNFVKDGYNKKYLQYFYIIITFIIFSLNQWENIVMSNGIALMAQMLFFILVYVYSDILLINGRSVKNILVLILALAFGILVFGGGYVPALIISLISAILLDIYLKKPQIKSNVLNYLIILLTSASMLFIYFYKISEGNTGTEGGSVIEKCTFILKHIIDALQYFFLSVASSVVGVNLSDAYINIYIVEFIGVVLTLAYVGTIILYFKSKMYEKTYVPLMLIIQTFLVYMMILVGRFDYGIKYGMSSRYVTYTQYGLIAILWVMFYFLCENSDTVSKVLKNSLLFVIGLIVVGQSLTNLKEWQIAPYRKANFTKMQMMALYPSEFDKNDFNLFQSDTEKVFKGIDIIKKYKLNVYHDYDFNSGMKSGDIIFAGDLKSGILGSGWYEKEGKNRWISKSAKITVKSGSEGKVIIEGNVPDFLSPNEIKVYADNELITSQSISNSSFKLEGKIKPNSVVNLRIESSKSIIPKQNGMNNDTRELSAIINNIRTN